MSRISGKTFVHALKHFQEDIIRAHYNSFGFALYEMIADHITTKERLEKLFEWKVLTPIDIDMLWMYIMYNDDIISKNAVIPEDVIYWLMCKLDKQALVNYRNKYTGASILSSIPYSNNISNKMLFIRYIVEECGADVNAPNIEGKFVYSHKESLPLENAILLCDIELITYYLDHGADLHSLCIEMYLKEIHVNSDCQGCMGIFHQDHSVEKLQATYKLLSDRGYDWNAHKHHKLFYKEGVLPWELSTDVRVDAETGEAC